VQDWITAELAYDRFMQEDPIFKEQNDGFTYPGSRYVITVPQSFVVPPTADAVDANRILLEEFIPADKLTEEFSELEQRGHDMRDVISLISRNYLTQLRHGLVHSDVSIGNFLLRRGKRAGERTEVMIIDRNFYLAIKPELAAWMQPFLTALEFLASPTEEYLSKLSLYEPHDLTADRRAEAGAGLAELRELILRGTFAAGPMLSAIRKLTALTPEVADLVEYLIDPRTVSLVPAHAFVTRAAKIAKCTLDTREVARLSEEWGSAKNRLFTAGEWTGIIGALQQISAALGSAGAKTEVVTRVLDVASILLEPAAAQLDRVLRLSITKSTAIKHRPQLLKEWQEIRDNVMRGDASGIGAFLQSLRQRGIRFPLEVTLICKNLVALHHMARKAGLSRGLADALTYTTKHAPAHACPP
jgi:hypothetical protein